VNQDRWRMTNAKNTTRAQDCGKGSWAAEPSPQNQVQLLVVISPEPPAWGTVTSDSKQDINIAILPTTPANGPAQCRLCVLLRRQAAATAHLFIAAVSSASVAVGRETTTVAPAVCQR